MKISKHAIKRIRQRIGVRKKDRARRIAHDALRDGVPLKQLPDEVRKFVDENCCSAKVLVYKNFIYIFREYTLVTVFNLPQDLHFKSKSDEIKQEQKKIEMEKNRPLKCPVCHSINFHVVRHKNRFQLQCNDCKTMSKSGTSIESCKRDIKRKLQRQEDIYGPVD